MSSTANSDDSSGLANDARINLLLLDTELTMPKAQASALRQAGFNLHPRILTNPDKLAKTLQTQAVDILICNEGRFDGLQVLEISSRYRSKLPVILVSPQRDPKRLGEVLAQGARDLIPRDDLVLLVEVFRRELESLEQSRQTHALLQQLDESRQHNQYLVDHSNEAIAYLTDGIHLGVNRAYQDLFGFIDADTLIGQPLRSLTAHRDYETLEHLLHKTLDNQASGEVELCMHTQDYRQFDALIRFSPARLEQQDCTQISIRNLTRVREIEQRIALLADYDSETGLASRRHFLNQLDEHIPELQQGKPGSLIYLSIDNMPSLRVQAGERASGKLLSEIGSELSRITEQTGLFARLGDHSFALYCRYQDMGTTNHLADALIQRLDNKTYASMLPDRIRPRFHLGLAQGTSRIETGQQLLEQAFRAYEAARSQNADRWLWFDSSMDQPTLVDNGNHDQEIVELIDDALSSDRFRLFYQPVVSFNGDSREHYSVLVRMLRSDNQTLLPESFLHYAQNHGRMAAIDRWVIRNAVAELTRQRQQRHRVNLFIQLSANSIRDPDLLLWICDCLQMQDAKGPWLTFQISDRDIRSNPSSSRELIKGLKRISCRLAISRFGVLANYATLVERLPLDYIKLDASYLKQLPTDPQRQRRLNSICQLAKKHDVQVVVGEVEEEDCLRILWDAGVNYVQGYLLQEPTQYISQDFSIVEAAAPSDSKLEAPNTSGLP